ncbi:MAG: outer membrane lipoprotein-sorting protein [Acidobacteriota bacterium]|nr:outer membrane lipoprotein-sorting protein [Acidobacteriota bacterium]
MQRKLFLVVLALLIALPLVAQDLTADQIIAKNIEARGGMAKLKAVKTMKATGKMMVGPGIEAPVIVYQRRPDQMRMEITVQGLTLVQAYDGKTGWAIVPFQGKKDAEQMTADDVKEVKEQADIDGALVDYKLKGHKVELLGKDKVEGSDAYKLKLTRANGDVETIYVDADSFLEVKTEGKRTIRGTEMETDSNIGDYKEVDGLIVPFSIDSGAKGRPERQKITVEKYEFNVPVDAAMFVMPPPAPKAATPPADKDKKEPAPAATTPAEKPKTADKPKN